MPPTALHSDHLHRILTEVHAELRRSLAGAATSVADTAPDTAARNAKGDLQQPFDLAADAVIRRCLEARLPGGVILSEESEEWTFGEGTPEYRFVVDPVDGSDNRARGLPLSATSIAVLRQGEPIHCENVLWALVGGLEDEFPVIASRAAGAFRGTERLRTSGVRALGEAFLSCELNHFSPTRQVGTLLCRARAVRTYGCASQALTRVATGALDAHIDVRDRLTPESFLAASLILGEAGGCLLDAEGSPLGEFTTIQQRTTLVAAATPELAQEILDVLHSRDP